MENDYKLFVSRGYTRGSILDKKDGFIHLSARYQLIGTINKHFFLVKKLYIICFSTNSLNKNLKWEITRNGEFFPHYFGYLKFEKILYSFIAKGKNNFY